MIELLSGNEAIARGAWEAGVGLGAGYPGTPSTEILQNLVRYPNVYAEWCPNEKVALEVASGAAFGGSRALATMKHVGLNLAADPLLSLSYSGIRGGLVIVTADDPAMHSSQNEQDNRHYARFAKLPMLEPSDSQEAYEMTKKAFELSEKYDCPVLLRTTTRVNHARSLVNYRNRRKEIKNPGFIRDRRKFVLIPAYARERHQFVEKRMAELKTRSDGSEMNRVEMADKRYGIVTSGVAYQYAKEAFPDWSFLKLGMSWPLPDQMIRGFARRVGQLFVVEELDPFLECYIRALGLKVKGKEKLPLTGEFDPDIIRGGLRKTNRNSLRHIDGVPPRPPQLCKGCPHRGVFEVLKKLKVIVTGDIGCYTLGVLPPFEAMDTCICMGAGVSQAHGMDRASNGKTASKTVAVIGDSTFMHSGVTALMNIVYNNGASTVMVLDNSTTAMTGMQPHPGTGSTLNGQPANQVDIATLAKALGVKRIFKADPGKRDELEALLRRELKEKEPSLIITNRPCIELLRKNKRAAGKPVQAEGKS